MTFVLSVIAASIFVSSIFIVSGRMSTKTSVAPANTNELAVDEKVNEGRITSSPGSKSHKKAAISNAVDPLVVRSAFFVPNLSSIHLSHFFVNGPSPQIF